VSERRTIVLVEHESIETELAPADVHVLASRHGPRFKLQPLGGRHYRLRAKSWVGTVGLAESTLRVVPKCGLRNLVRMFGEVYDFTPSDEWVERADSREPSELLIEMLATEVEGLVGRGVRRDYAEVDRWSSTIRGRLLVGEALRRPSPQLRELPCRQDIFTPDIFANRVIRFTLEQLTGIAKRTLGNRLERLRRLFGEIGLEPIRPARLDGLRYSRLDAHYRPIHALCRIILEARGIDEGTGPYQGPALLIDMNALFERFVAKRILSLAPRGWHVDRQYHTSVDDRGRIPAIPDLVCVADGRPVAAIDTKYKLLRGAPKSADAYQALAYARSLGLRSVMLFYPNVRERSSYTSVDGENEIVVDGIDLGAEWPQIEEDLRAVMDRLL
jgi:5-methylcytosine-specific restriction enzyme subunit McrC